LNEQYIFSVNVVAYLKALHGIEPIRTELNNSTNKVCFWFERNEQITIALQEYFQNEDLLKFIKCLKDTKKHIHTFK
jgi:hypothetical protein